MRIRENTLYPSKKACNAGFPNSSKALTRASYYPLSFGQTSENRVIKGTNVTLRYKLIEKPPEKVVSLIGLPKEDGWKNPYKNEKRLRTQSQLHT